MIILFDLDGTLIDSTEAILESFHNSFDFYRCSHPDDEDIKKLIGHPLDIMYRELGIQEDNIDDFVSKYKEHYREISTKKTVLLKNAEKAIIEAAKIATLGIVTTKTGKYSRVLMQHFGLMKYFDVLIGREDVKEAKPSPEPIFKALEKLNCNDEDIWMIGDTRMDLISAKNAGVKSIALLSGYDKKSELQKHCNIVFYDSLEAILYLKSIKNSHY